MVLSVVMLLADHSDLHGYLEVLEVTHEHTVNLVLKMIFATHSLNLQTFVTNMSNLHIKKAI